MKRKILTAIITGIITIGLIGCGSDTANDNQKPQTQENGATSDATTSASVDATTSASIVPENLVQNINQKDLQSQTKKKALFVIGDPRKDSVNYDLAITAMKHFEEKNVEVEVRDLYDMKFNPVLSLENFYYAKDGKGEPTPEIKKEQEICYKGRLHNILLSKLA